jgi:hypothetical protein
MHAVRSAVNLRMRSLGEIMLMTSASFVVEAHNNNAGVGIKLRF